MSQDVPVRRSDLLVLVVLSVSGGGVLATWLAVPELSPQFASAIMAATMLVAFFLFIPVLGARLFLEESGD